MNVNNIRKALAALMAANGYQATEYVPEDVSKYPAAIVGVPDEILYDTSLGLAQVVLPITIAVSIASYQDAQRRLDDAVSTDDPTSPVSILRGLEAATDDWRSVQVLRADNVRIATAGQTRALALDVVVQVITRK